MDTDTANRDIARFVRLQLSAKQKTRRDAVASKPDEQIDYSDTPSLQNAVWRKAAADLPHTSGKAVKTAPAPLEHVRHGVRSCRS